MVERLNCVQNQVTIANRVLTQNKVAGFIITGGQDNVQAVAAQLLGFFAEGVQRSEELHEASRSLAQRARESCTAPVRRHARSDASQSGQIAGGDLVERVATLGRSLA